MATASKIRPVEPEGLEELLPLIAAYQRFYEVENPDDERNREFFRRFLAPSDDGLILGAYDAGGELLGYACLYWFFSSLRPSEAVLLNDLFVAAETRGQGVGRALIEAALDVARERGASHLEWSTAPDNHTAQALYDGIGAERTEWVSYELPV